MTERGIHNRSIRSSMGFGNKVKFPTSRYSPIHGPAAQTNNSYDEKQLFLRPGGRRRGDPEPHTLP